MIGRYKQTLCWQCLNSVPSVDGERGCSWSRTLTPVKGWKATKLKELSLDLKKPAYRVEACPEFQPDPMAEYLDVPICEQEMRREANKLGSQTLKQARKPQMQYRPPKPLPESKARFRKNSQHGEEMCKKAYDLFIAFCKQRNLAQKYAAEEIGISSGLPYRWKCGETFPSEKVLEMMEKQGIDVSCLRVEEAKK